MYFALKEQEIMEEFAQNIYTILSFSEKGTLTTYGVVCPGLESSIHRAKFHYRVMLLLDKKHY